VPSLQWATRHDDAMSCAEIVSLDVHGAALTPSSAITRREGLRWAIGLGTAALAGRPACAAAAAAATLHWRETAMLALGTTAWLRVGHEDDKVAALALAAAAAAVHRVDAALSLFRPDSAISQLNRAGFLHAPPAELVQALRTALRVARLTAGAFDPTVQPLWRAWYEAHLQGQAPSARELQFKRSQLNWRGVEVSDTLIRLAQPGMALTLNGIAQGYAADCAGAALRQHGVQHALLDTGEWLPLGHSAQEQTPWRLAIADTRTGPRIDTRTDVPNDLPTHPPAQTRATPPAGSVPATVATPHRAAAQQRRLPTVLADGRAIACSSDAKLAFSADRTEHHILDPRTGHSPRSLATVLVTAPSAAWADALTKPLFMAGAPQAMALAHRLGVDVLVVDKAGRWQASPGWRLA
jgi:FAD:protein FMN transferase